MPNDNDRQTQRAKDANLFRLAIAYLDERIAWLQQERRDLIDAEARRQAERDARAGSPS